MVAVHSCVLVVLLLFAGYEKFIKIAVINNPANCEVHGIIRGFASKNNTVAEIYRQFGTALHCANDRN